MAKWNLWLTSALICGLWPSAFAQNAISAKAGLVQVADGEVFVNDKAVEHQVGQFTDLKSKDILSTGEGRTEVLLTPGAFLRMTDSSGVRMVSTRLSDVRMDMLKGEAVIEVAELLTDNAITVNVGTASFALRKGGIYRFDAEPGRLRVYEGEAVATQGDKIATVKSGREFAYDGSAWALGHFDTKETDALYRWSARRSGNIAVANVSAARQAGAGYSGYMNSGYSGMYGYGLGSLGYGGAYGTGGLWMFNPYYGMYTYMPYGGTAWSPFGYAYYTPITVVPVYAYAPVQGAPVTRVGPVRGAPGPGLPTHTAAVRVTPSLHTSSALRTSAVTRGGAVPAYSGYRGGNANYPSGYSGNSSNSSYAGSVGSSSSSSSVSSAPARSAGGGSSGPAAGGGGGATRSH